MSAPRTIGEYDWLSPRPLAAIAFAVLLAGLYARFKGLGTWPLGVDEFYISRSIDNVLRSGLPEYECGGYYPRGLVFQYVVAALRLTGLTPEFAGRLVTAASSLAVLPAAWLIGKRAHGAAVGWLVVIVLSISVWEVEMARFARMYAPFQAVFAWYLVFFLQYTVDRKRSALRPMILLSVLGVFLWEGGAMLGLTNLLPPLINHDQGRLRRRDWLYLGGMTILFIAMFAFVQMDFRGMADPANLPSDLEPDRAPDRLSPPQAPFTTLPFHTGWMLLALAPMALAVASLRWIVTLRTRWLAACGLLAALLAALLHQYLACFAILCVLMLMRWIDWRDLTSRPARPFVMAIIASAAFWIAFSLGTTEWRPAAATGGSPQSEWFALALAFLGFPNILAEIALPWGRAIPYLSLGLLASLAALTVSAILSSEREAGAVRTLLIALLVLVLLIGASDPPRHETRYAFFLYPLMIVLAIAAVAMLAETLTSVPRHQTALTALCVLALYALSEDFQPRHLLTIDSRETNFRLGLKPALRSHYYPRADIRGAADWLAERVRPGDIVISGIPNLDAYYAQIDYFLLDREDPRYRAYACENATLERWTNRPLLRDIDDIKATGRQRVFVVAFPAPAKRLGSEVLQRTWRLKPLWTSVDGQINVLVLTGNRQ